MRAEKDSKVTSNVKVSAGWSVPIMPLEISFIQFYWGREKQTFLPLFNICRKSVAIDLQQVELELDQNCGFWVLEGKREGIAIFHSSIMDITWIRSKFGHQMASLELPQLVSSLELVVNFAGIIYCLLILVTRWRQIALVTILATRWPFH